MAADYQIPGNAPLLDLKQLSDVDITSPTDGQALVYSATLGKWINMSGGGGAEYLAELLDVDLGASPEATDGQVLTYSAALGKWVASSAGGGVAPGTAVWPWLPRTGYTDNGFSLYTIMLKLGGPQLLSCPAKWSFSLWLAAGASYTIGQAAVLRTLANSLTVIDSTTVEWSGSPTPTLGGGVTFSDAINLQLDNTHDYWIMVYFTSTSGNMECVQTPVTNLNTIPVSPQVGYATGNQIIASATTINYGAFTAEEDIFTVVSS